MLYLVAICALILIIMRVEVRLAQGRTIKKLITAWPGHCSVACRSPAGDRLRVTTWLVGLLGSAAEGWWLA